MVTHLDDLGCAYDVEIVGRAVVLFQELADALLVAEQHDAAILANLLECHHSTLHSYLGREVATHSIDTDF